MNKRRTKSLDDDEIISDDWSDISDVAVEIETLKKGKKNSNLVDRRFEHVLVKSIHIIFHEHTQKNSKKYDNIGAYILKIIST